ncbi:Transposase [Caenorhabditis elegans]|uniref:Transposase n=1 Tax=Caenorhabditis elegans TaxID=6239 RepID=F5GUF4_CAEEL|nr:Transposase [Caenorhabditis elegans]CCA65549.1 Transposase [Caenorhabditis elegans]|eukprot:NP_001256731.1 Uncharacterized protein CELE_F09C6.11 [Caenorhabditis elegans]
MKRMSNELIRLSLKLHKNITSTCRVYLVWQRNCPRENDSGASLYVLKYTDIHDSYPFKANIYNFE